MVMMDLKVKESSSDESGDINNCCADCKTTKTPLWRGGAAGSKSWLSDFGFGKDNMRNQHSVTQTLCNACGIRYRKRMSSAVRLNKGLDRKRDRAHNSSGSAAADAVSHLHIHLGHSH